jgi:NAD(P)-dependent dehydrogenase (short-subunit alcohol dehydrogenase family)
MRGLSAKQHKRIVILGTVTITLMAGADKGLGRETARRLLEASHTVLVGAQNAECGRRAVGDLGAVFLEIDPTSDNGQPHRTGGHGPVGSRQGP